MSLHRPLVRLFAAQDGFLERCEPTTWGALVSDSRLPLIYDANYARVERGADLSLEDVDAALLAFLRESGARFAHVVTFDPPGTPRLVRDIEGHGTGLTRDTVMRTNGAPPDPGGAHPVRELSQGPELWERLRAALPEFDIRDRATIDQVVTWQREILAPHGKRWFAVELDGATAGLGSVFVHEDAAYVDDVVTLPWARRRGVASAIVRHMVAVSLGAGAEHAYLLADTPGPILLYERLGFRAVGEVLAVVRPMP